MALLSAPYQVSPLPGAPPPGAARLTAAGAGVAVVDTAPSALRPATGLDFRHGAAVHQLRAGVPLSEVSQQLGHARIDTTAVYTRLTDAERRRYADRVAW